MKIALVHDYLNQYGGAERVLEVLSEIFPEASIYTLFYDEKLTYGKFANKNILTSFLQKFPIIRQHHHFFMMLMPYAARTLDLSDYDLVFSDSASYGKGVKVGKDAVHICYCHTPLRYAWEAKEYLKEYPWPGFVKFFLPPLLFYLRKWDKRASGKIHYFIANSNFIAGRIKRFYEREAEVIYPPYDENRFYFNEEKFAPHQFCGKTGAGYYLAVGRFLHYKKFDLIVRAFNKLNRRLIIIGAGPEEKRLKEMAGTKIEFKKFISNNDELRFYYTNAEALIFPQIEDFGLTAVEAMACGTPVIAFRAGGVTESVKDGITGVFFDSQTEDSLIEAVKKFETQCCFCDKNGAGFNRQAIADYAKQFGKERFKKEIKNFVNNKVANLREFDREYHEL